MSAHQYYRRRMLEDYGVIGLGVFVLGVLAYVMQATSAVWMP